MRPGTNNNQAALLNILDNETLVSVVTRGVKRFLLQRGGKDTIKTLITARDTSVESLKSFQTGQGPLASAR
jgi:hypothetical protein